MAQRTCKHCGCTDSDCRQCIEKTGHPCRWVSDDACSACVPVGEAISFTYQGFDLSLGFSEVDEFLILEDKFKVSAWSSTMVKEPVEMDISITVSFETYSLEEAHNIFKSTSEAVKNGTEVPFLAHLVNLLKKFETENGR